MKYYTIEDWGLAKWLIQTRFTLEHRICDIVWATKVMSFFKAYTKIVNIITRNYLRYRDEATKYVWTLLTKFRNVNQIYSLLKDVRVRLLVHNRQSNGIAYYGYVTIKQKLKQKRFGTKARRVMRCMKRTDLLTNQFSKGIAIW